MPRQRSTSLRRRATTSSRRMQLWFCLSLATTVAIAAHRLRQGKHRRSIDCKRGYNVQSKDAAMRDEPISLTQHNLGGQEPTNPTYSIPAITDKEHIDGTQGINRTLPSNTTEMTIANEGTSRTTLISESECADATDGNTDTRRVEHESIDVDDETTRQRASAHEPAAIMVRAPVLCMETDSDACAGAQSRPANGDYLSLEPVARDVSIDVETGVFGVAATAQADKDASDPNPSPSLDAERELQGLERVNHNQECQVDASCCPSSPIRIFAESDAGAEADTGADVKANAPPSSTRSAPSTPPGLTRLSAPTRSPLRATARPFVPRILDATNVYAPPRVRPDAPPSSSSSSSGSGANYFDASLADSSPYTEKYWTWDWYAKDEELKAMIEEALAANGAKDGTLRAKIEAEYRAEIEEGWEAGLEKYEKKKNEGRRRWVEERKEEGARNGSGFMWTLKENTKSGERKKTRKPFQQANGFANAQVNTNGYSDGTGFKPMHRAFSSLYTKKPSISIPSPPPVSPPESIEATSTLTCEGFWPADAIRDRAYTFLNRRNDVQTDAEKAYEEGDLTRATELVVEEHRVYEIGILFHDAAAALLFFVKNEGYFETVQEAMGSWKSGFTKKVKEKKRREKEMKEGSSDGHGSGSGSEGSSDDDSETSFDALQHEAPSEPLEPIILPLPPVNPLKLRKCDLHGLLIREARHYVLQHLELCRAHRIPSTDIVTGWGKSSKDNDAKLKPRVKEILEKYEEEQEGKVVIDRKKRNDGMFTLRMTEW